MADIRADITDKMPPDVQDLCRRAANVYERCRRYSGRLIHDVNCFAGALLNGVHNLAGIWDIDAAGRDDAAEIEELRRDFKASLERWLGDGLKKLGGDLP
jgi:hypothetical protein